MRQHTEDPRFLCSCNDCCREAARTWRGYMARVHDGELTLDEANRLMDAR